MSDTDEADPAPDEEENGLRVVLTPVQLAAVIEGADISEGDAASNRVFGALKVVGGAIELCLGTGLILAPEPTTASKIGGAALLLHGQDTVIAGWLEVTTGRSVPTLTETAVAAAATLAGVSPRRARDIGVAVDVLVPAAVSAGLAAARAIAVRRGTIRLLVDEATGAHTIRRHLYRSDSAMRQRLRELLESGRRAPRSISTFESAEEAGRAISRCMNHHGAALKSWARSARPGQTRSFELEVGDIGRGVMRDTGAIVRMSKVRVVVRKALIGNRMYYVLTAYPVP